ncbi:MAG: hypothetical protein M0P91_11450 [Sulfuricurvum sp.]|jgi:hypothetical protein|uniref:tetratricopeptide repeat protein n=1 Tax=Sulfuricurvum sp. TaxID=2025608 RepID=UPI0025DE25CB|nr:hypothetical protein [Sulfuricurvum sp.]MCK9373807.1 hypothetical protein [Sulfuricurvum sp.]
MKSALSLSLLLLVVLIVYIFYSLRFPYLNGLIYQKIGWDHDAFTMFNDACESNNTLGCMQLGIMYNSGNYVHKDSIKAKALFERSCRLGAGTAFTYFKNADEQPQDFKKAFELYKEVCDKQD